MIVTIALNNIESGVLCGLKCERKKKLEKSAQKSVEKLNCAAFEAEEREKRQKIAHLANNAMHTQTQ